MTEVWRHSSSSLSPFTYTFTAGGTERVYEKSMIKLSFEHMSLGGKLSPPNELSSFHRKSPVSSDLL